MLRRATACMAQVHVNVLTMRRSHPSAGVATVGAGAYSLTVDVLSPPSVTKLTVALTLPAGLAAGRPGPASPPLCAHASTL
jgi:hypothetical protein